MSTTMQRLSNQQESTLRLPISTNRRIADDFILRQRREQQLRRRRVGRPRLRLARCWPELARLLRCSQRASARSFVSSARGERKKGETNSCFGESGSFSNGVGSSDGGNLLNSHESAQLLFAERRGLTAGTARSTPNTGSATTGSTIAAKAASAAFFAAFAF